MDALTVAMSAIPRVTVPSVLPPGDGRTDIPHAIRSALVCWYSPRRQGCTNEDMAENPVLRDLSGNGVHLMCKNFAWTERSGIMADGGLCFDGTDDYGITTNLPSMYRDFTAVYKRRFYEHVERYASFFGTENPRHELSLFMLSHNTHDNTVSILGNSNGGFNPAPMNETAVEWYTPTLCQTDSQRLELTPGDYTHDDGKQLLVARNRMENGLINPFILYSFILFKRTLTEDEINLVIDKMID